jgi:flagellar biosynthesis anti-sigma factor FlgM
MRIDLYHEPQPSQESNRSSSRGTSVLDSPFASNGLDGSGEDQAELSGTLVQVLALMAQASQLPEVRQERISALRQAVQSGSYQTSPEQVAEAVLTHMIAGVAA